MEDHPGTSGAPLKPVRSFSLGSTSQPVAPPPATITVHARPSASPLLVSCRPIPSAIGRQLTNGVPGDQASGCAQVTSPPQQNLRKPGWAAPRPQNHGESSCVQNQAGGCRCAPTMAQLRAAGFLREVKSSTVSAVRVRTLSSGFVLVTPADDG